MRRMIGYVSLGASDNARAKRFYDAALGPLGIVNDCDNEAKRVLPWGLLTFIDKR